MEISGQFGMFPDPSTGGNSASYPIPPPSACIGMIESVCRFPCVDVEIKAVGICSEEIAFQSFDYNNSSAGGRKTTLIESQSPWQLSTTILRNPIFQIIAILRNSPNGNSKLNNNAHAMQDRFMRRLKKGQNFRTPTLGQRELIAEYCGVPRTPINTSLNLEIVSFPIGNVFSPSGVIFRRQSLEKGIAVYEKGYKPSFNENFCFTV